MACHGTGSEICIDLLVYLVNHIIYLVGICKCAFRQQLSWKNPFCSLETCVPKQEAVLNTKMNMKFNSSIGHMTEICAYPMCKCNLPICIFTILYNMLIEFCFPNALSYISLTYVMPIFGEILSGPCGWNSRCLNAFLLVELAQREVYVAHTLTFSVACWMWCMYRLLFV